MSKRDYFSLSDLKSLSSPNRKAPSFFFSTNLRKPNSEERNSFDFVVFSNSSVEEWPKCFQRRSQRKWCKENRSTWTKKKKRSNKQFRTSNIQEENSFSYAHIVAKFIERRIDDRRIIRRAFSLDSVDRIIRHEKTKQMTKSKNEGSRSFNRHG